MPGHTVLALSGRTDSHAESLFFMVSTLRIHNYVWASAYRRERSDFLVSVGVEVLLCVVDCHAPVDTSRQCVILHDLDTFVASIRVLEEEYCRPVVAEVLTEGACRACALISNVTGHVGTEGIATDDLNLH